MQNLIIVFTALLFFLTTPLASAQDLSATQYTYKNINEWHNEFDKLSKEVEQTKQIPNDEFHKSSQENIAKFKALATDCEEYLKENMTDIERELDIIGEKPDQDTAVVASARSSLKNEQVRHQRKLTSCKLLFVKVEKTSEILSDLALKKETQKRLYQAFSLIDLVKNLTDLELFTFLGRTGQSTNWGSEKFSAFTWFFWTVGLCILIPALTLLFKRRERSLRGLSTTHLSDNALYHFLTNNHILLFLFSVVIYCWAFVFVWQLLTHTTIPLSQFLFTLTRGLLFLCITNSLFTGKVEQRFITSIPKAHLKSLRRHTRFLIIYYMIVYLSISWPNTVEVNQVTANLSHLIILSLFSFSMSFIAWILIGHSIIKVIRPTKYLIPVISIMITAALISGYFNFIEFVCLTVTVSYFSILAVFFLYRVITDFFDSLDEGRYIWQQNLKKTLDIPSSEIVPGVIWLRIFVVIIMFSGVIIFLMDKWTSTHITGEKMLGYISNGFVIGQMSIVPIQILQSLIFIAVAMSVLFWTRKQFELRVLSKSRMDVGTRDALGSMLIYTLGLFTILTAISIAGVNLGNIAIIAGALSVGIGFGLQAIVNNFVSGLILLLERPIQKGDWIVVGQTEGHVKKISVRSTLIQTFDHADVIVPNSDLITHVVKNWTLKNFRGRLTIPIGVSYDCDIEQVKDILIDIASHKDEISTDPLMPKPHVLLMEFGERAVNLELRFFVTQVNDSLRISSEVRFEILKRFKEANIIIPYPQRVVHMAKSEEPTKHTPNIFKGN